MNEHSINHSFLELVENACDESLSRFAILCAGNLYRKTMGGMGSAVITNLAMQYDSTLRSGAEMEKGGLAATKSKAFISINGLKRHYPEIDDGFYQCLKSLFKPEPRRRALGVARHSRTVATDLQSEVDYQHMLLKSICFDHKEPFCHMLTWYEVESKANQRRERLATSSHHNLIWAIKSAIERAEEFVVDGKVERAATVTVTEVSYTRRVQKLHITSQDAMFYGDIEEEYLKE